MKTITRYTLCAAALLFLAAGVLHAQSSTPGSSPEGIELKKTVTPGSMPNTYTIDLEAFVTGQTQTVLSGGDLDVILVLDFSTSLSGDNWANLKKSAADFLKNIRDYKINYSANARVGVISFGKEANNLTNGLIDPTSDEAATLIYNFENNGVSTAGTTQIDLAMERAREWMETYYRADASKCVVVFTDGKPEGSSRASALIAKDAVNEAWTIKNTYGAEIYSIGLLTAKQESTVIKRNESDVRQRTVNGTMQLTTGSFLRMLSSEYPNAYIEKAESKLYMSPDYETVITYKSGWETPHNTDVTYYQKAETNTLESIFNEIGKNVIGGASYSLTATSTTVIDVVSPAFKLPDGATGSTISLHVAKCTSVQPIDAFGHYKPIFEADEDMTKLISIGPGGTMFTDAIAKVGNLDDNKIFHEEEGGKTVQVSNFDFSENWCGAAKSGSTVTPHGYKLVISFPIEIDPRNPGGANVATNTEDSGIYFDLDGDGTPDQIGSFDIPHAKIPNLVVLKYGLHKGESATYRVINKDTEDTSPIVLVATQKSDDPTVPAVARVKIQKPGRYEVKETSWSWAYELTTRDSSYDVDDATTGPATSTETWNELGYGDPGAGYQAAIPTVFGTNVPDGTTSIIRNVNDLTEDPTYSGTLYIFRSTMKTGTPAHAEAIKNNEFYEAR